MKKILFFTIMLCCFIPIFADNYYQLVDSSDIYIKKGDFVGAERFILQALKEEPANINNSLLLSNLATLQRSQKRNKEALKNYDLALYMTPNAVTLLKNRASLYFEIDSIDRSFRDYSRVLELDPKDLYARYMHGMILLEKGDNDKSKKDFESILIDAPKSKYGLEGMGLWNKLNNKEKEAVKYYDALLADTLDTSYLINRAECYLTLNSPMEASKDINILISREPENGYYYFLKARLNKLQFLNDEAIKNANLAIKFGEDAEMVKKEINFK